MVLASRRPDSCATADEAGTRGRHRCPQAAGRKGPGRRRGRRAPTQGHGSNTLVRFVCHRHRDDDVGGHRIRHAAGEKLRSHGLAAGQLTVLFHTNLHKRKAPQHHASRRVSLHPMTADSLELLAAARRGVERDDAMAMATAMRGSCSTIWSPPSSGPSRCQVGPPRRAWLMKAMDAVNGRFGNFTLVPAA